jgi:pimeloyl-ACP methyl ester carboxylesterase
VSDSREGDGHWMQLDRPDAVNQLLVDFLTRVESPARI